MKLNLPDALSGTLDNELNLALCEWLGWHKGKCKCGCDREWIDPKDQIGHREHQLPNHITSPESLGLVHEVEKGLDSRQRKDYILALNEGYGAVGLDLTDVFLLVHSTARQRVIALLMTVKPEIFQ